MDPTTYQATGSIVLNWEGSNDAVIEIPGLFDEPYPVKDAISMVNAAQQPAQKRSAGCNLQ